MAHQPKVGVWLSDTTVSTAEIVAGLGYDFVLLDVEHGVFDLDGLDRHIPLLRALGLTVITKVMGPTQEAVQQALDLGSDGVIIPHVHDLAQARAVTAFAKFPPRGRRSVAGGRQFGYDGWTDQRLAELDATQLCFPLIEDPQAVRDVEDIMALDTVDGFHMGPGDLSLLSGRGALKLGPDDWADINHCIDVAQRAGKATLYAAWTADEQRWARERGIDWVVVALSSAAMRSALAGAKTAFDDLRPSAP